MRAGDIQDADDTGWEEQPVMCEAADAFVAVLEAAGYGEVMILANVIATHPNGDRRAVLIGNNEDASAMEVLRLLLSNARHIARVADLPLAVVEVPGQRPQG